MALIYLLLLALSAIALVFQLFTPIILNIPAMAVVLLTFVLAAQYFRRRRRKVTFPVFAGLNLLLQGFFLMLSFAIFFVITLPNESLEDSPAVVQGIRNILVSQGWISKPKSIAPPDVRPKQAEDSPERVNAPDASAVTITVEDAEKPASKGSEVEKP